MKTLLATVLTAFISWSALAASKVTFDNQSGSPALVKLVGPTESSVSVENGTKESLSVAAGHYFIKIRYGRPGSYSFSKGDEFDVKETATTASDITITLHKVVAGNYGSKAISEAEFGSDEQAAQPSAKAVVASEGKSNNEGAATKTLSEPRVQVKSQAGKFQGVLVQSTPPKLENAQLFGKDVVGVALQHMISEGQLQPEWFMYDNGGSRAISGAKLDARSTGSRPADSRWQESLPPWVAAAQKQLSYEVKVKVNNIRVRTGGNALMFIVNGGVTNRGTQKCEFSGKPAILFTVRTPDSSVVDDLSLRLPLDTRYHPEGAWLETSFGLGGQPMKDPDLLACASEVLSYNDGGTTHRLIVLAHGMTLSDTTTDTIGTHREYSRPTSVVWPYEKKFLQRVRDAEKETPLGICARLLTEQIDTELGSDAASERRASAKTELVSRAPWKTNISLFVSELYDCAKRCPDPKGRDIAPHPLASRLTIGAIEYDSYDGDVFLGKTTQGEINRFLGDGGVTWTLPIMNVEPSQNNPGTVLVSVEVPVPTTINGWRVITRSVFEGRLRGLGDSEAEKLERELHTTSFRVTKDQANSLGIRPGRVITFRTSFLKNKKDKLSGVTAFHSIKGSATSLIVYTIPQDQDQVEVLRVSDAEQK